MVKSPKSVAPNRPWNNVTAEGEGRTSSCWASAGTCAQGDQISTVLGVSSKDAEGTNILVWGYISVMGQLWNEAIWAVKTKSKLHRGLSLGFSALSKLFSILRIETWSVKGSGFPLASGLTRTLVSSRSLVCGPPQMQWLHGCGINSLPECPPLRITWDRSEVCSSLVS